MRVYLHRIDFYVVNFYVRLLQRDVCLPFYETIKLSSKFHEQGKNILCLVGQLLDFYKWYLTLSNVNAY